MSKITGRCEEVKADRGLLEEENESHHRANHISDMATSVDRRGCKQSDTLSSLEVDEYLVNPLSSVPAPLGVKGGPNAARPRDTKAAEKGATKAGRALRSANNLRSEVDELYF